MLLNVIVIYVIYVFCILCASYYIDLLMKKEEYSRDDIKNLVPYFNNLWENINQKYSLPHFMAVLIISSLLSILLTLATSNVLLNSSLLFIVIFFVLPVVAGNLEKTMVTDTENYSDLAAHLIIKYSNVCIIAFGFGTGSALIFSWSVSRSIGFIWFLLNSIVIIVLTVNKIRELSRQ